MIVTYNWLKEFVDFDQTPEELADLLTMLGLEVEGMERRFEGMDDVVVAIVLEKEKHPNADKLSLCKVNNGSEILNIVCGAQNFQAGDKVALAQIGAVLPGDFKIKKSKIRGEESCGMLCSEKELGLADESAGIMILPSNLPLGIPVFSALGLKDTIFEIGLTPNRADCLSVIGIAREIAAKTGKTVKQTVLSVQDGTRTADSLASVTIEAPDLCPRYTARYISGCTIKPSPQWLASRLQSVGMRSINNVVDVTNFVLFEYGHPLHAFDFDLLAGGKIVVKRAGEGEVFQTLDGQSRSLQHSDLTIRDGERAVALAGIMGGENSEIRDSTTNILLESAYFSPSSIRRTSKRLGLHTESSHRFERGADINILTTALDRAASLIAELADGEVAQGVIDVYPRPVEPKKITVRAEKINKLLGINLPGPEIVQLLMRLEFVVEVLEPGIYQVEVPSFRVDVEREIDIIEEIARLNGYDQIPVTMPIARVFSDRPPRTQRLESKLRNLLTTHGFNEVINFSFIAPDVCAKLLLPVDDRRCTGIKILNPLVDEQSVMRTTLLPGLLETVQRNLSYRTMNMRIFEFRRIYLPVPDAELPHEPLIAAGIMTGKRYPEGWNQAKEDVDFYDLKGVMEVVLDGLGISDPVYSFGDVPPFFHPGKSCSVRCKSEIIGAFGELHPTVQENFGFEKALYYFEIDFQKLLECIKDDGANVAVPPKFPDNSRDIALLLADEIPATDILKVVRSLRIADLEDVEIFDLYKGKGIPDGKKSIAVRVRYRSSQRTLTDEEVNQLHQQVMSKLVKDLNVSFR